MGTLTNTTKKLLGAWGERIPAGESIDVDDDKDWSNHMFVKSGQLEYVSSGSSSPKKTSDDDAEKKAARAARRKQKRAEERKKKTSTKKKVRRKKT